MNINYESKEDAVGYTFLVDYYVFILFYRDLMNHLGGTQLIRSA